MHTYQQRSELTKNPTAKKLLQLMEAKQTNLALSADVTSKNKLLELAESIGPEICMLKTHIDIIEDFEPSLIIDLQNLATQHNFVLFEDRKFADIGNTAKLQYEKGIFQIAKWASVTNAYIISGPEIITAMQEVGLPLGNGLLLMGELSSKGNLIKESYIQKAIDLAKHNSDFVIGFISQHRLIHEDDKFIYACPGVNLADKNDAHGQQYNTPEHVIENNKVDIIIVGRGIYNAENPLETAKQYRDAGWQAYQRRLHGK